MLGRLASATWSTGQEWFTYDAFGRVNSRSFIDTSVASNDHHYEIHEFHDDGSEKTLHLALQDTNKQDEQVNYGYDSAGRVNSVVYNFGGSSQNLFSPPPARARSTTRSAASSRAIRGGDSSTRPLRPRAGGCSRIVKVTAPVWRSRDISFPTDRAASSPTIRWAASGTRQEIHRAGRLDPSRPDVQSIAYDGAWDG